MINDIMNPLLNAAELVTAPSQEPAPNAPAKNRGIVTLPDGRFGLVDIQQGIGHLVMAWTPGTLYMDVHNSMRRTVTCTENPITTNIIPYPKIYGDKPYTPNIKLLHPLLDTYSVDARHAAVLYIDLFTMVCSGRILHNPFSEEVIDDNGIEELVPVVHRQQREETITLNHKSLTAICAERIEDVLYCDIEAAIASREAPRLCASCCNIFLGHTNQRTCSASCRVSLSRHADIPREAYHWVANNVVAPSRAKAEVAAENAYIDYLKAKAKTKNAEYDSAAGDYLELLDTAADEWDIWAKPTAKKSARATIEYAASNRLITSSMYRNFLLSRWNDLLKRQSVSL